MLTRSKTRAVAAESAEGQKGHEGSSLVGIKLPADWTELPIELLMMIFDNLTTQQSSYNEWKTSLLSCRLVNHQWKSAIEDLLEKKRLSFWSKVDNTYNPFEFPVVYFNPAGRQTVKNVVFPAFLQGNVGNSPFPSNTACLTSGETCKDNWVVSPKRDGHFFSKYGHHLTSLTIKNVNRKDFPAATLQQVLSCTPHLKAMKLSGIIITLKEKDVGKICLPPLPHLEHVRLDSVYGFSQSGLRGFEFNAENWVLEPYKEQLISITCNEALGCEYLPAIPIPNFPKLKQLHLDFPTAHQLLASVVFPSLQTLQLMPIYLNDFRMLELEHVYKFLSRMPNTLVELELDIVQDWRSEVNPINYGNNQSLQEVRKIQQRNFPALKMLTIMYPMYEEEVMVVKDFLKMFPNLVTLNFTRFDEYSRTLDPTELHRTAAREHLNREKYQGACLKLRTINVHTFMHSLFPFFTSQFPFSA